MEQLPELFVDGRKRKEQAAGAGNDALCEEIGRLKVELDRLKKKSGRSIEDRRRQVDRDHAEIRVGRQCELLGLSRSGLYYEPLGEKNRKRPRANRRRPDRSHPCRRSERSSYSDVCR